MTRALISALVGLMLAAPPAPAQTAQYKGLAAVSKELSARLAPPGWTLDLDDFAPAEDLEDLLGTWASFGSEHAFRNGVPNALTLAIWHMTFAAFAQTMGASCAAPQLVFHQRFLETLRAVCAWPADSAKSEATMSAFWLAVMGYNAPESEYRAWRDFFLASYGDRPADETIAAMTLSVTMNPHFLLHR